MVEAVSVCVVWHYCIHCNNCLPYPLISCPVRVCVCVISCVTLCLSFWFQTWMGLEKMLQLRWEMREFVGKKLKICLGQLGNAHFFPHKQFGISPNCWQVIWAFLFESWEYYMFLQTYNEFFSSCNSVLCHVYTDRVQVLAHLRLWKKSGIVGSIQLGRRRTRRLGISHCRLKHIFSLSL